MVCRDPCFRNFFSLIHLQNKSVVRVSFLRLYSPFLISSQTYHVLHQGRAEYTLITPGNPPVIEKKVMGTNVAAGEQRQLIVGTGVWKMSKIPQADLDAATHQDERDRTGCLITEVVTPGFHWEDHEFLTLEGLQELFRGAEGGEEKVKKLSPFVKKSA
jgi:predicted cupin superfamily sugar epimerase